MACIDDIKKKYPQLTHQEAFELNAVYAEVNRKYAQTTKRIDKLKQAKDEVSIARTVELKDKLPPLYARMKT